MSIATIGSIGNLAPLDAVIARNTETVKRNGRKDCGQSRYRVVLTTTASYGEWRHHIVVFANDHADANRVAKMQTSIAIAHRNWCVESCRII